MHFVLTYKSQAEIKHLFSKCACVASGRQTMYHSNAGYNTLKCDITALPNSQELSRAIVLLNFNLPKTVIDNRETELKDRLKQIEIFLMKHFKDYNVSYQLSASYWLKNQISEVKYRWVGSFFARDLQAASISGSVFLDFNSSNFVQNTWELLDNDNIVKSLTVNFLNSNWHFEELISVIVSCQLRVPVNHLFLIQHGLLQRRGRKTKRTHITLNPFAIDLQNMS